MTPPQLEHWTSGRSDRRVGENAGVALRFVAVLLDALIVFLPLGIIAGVMAGGGYAESGGGDVNAGVDLGGNAVLGFLVPGLGYYIVCEFATGMTSGSAWSASASLVKTASS